MFFDSIRLPFAAFSAGGVPVEQAQTEQKQVYSHDRGPQQFVFRAPVSDEQCWSCDQRDNRGDLASLDPGRAQLIFSSSIGMHDDEHGGLGLAVRVKNLAAHDWIALDLSFTEGTRVCQTVETKKSAIAQVIDFAAVGGEGVGGLHVFEEHGALCGPDERSPVRRTSRVVVYLEHSKRAFINGSHKNAQSDEMPMKQHYHKAGGNDREASQSDVP